VVRGFSAVQAVVYVVLVVIGIAIGYAIWGSAAQQPARVQTLTLTIPGAATMQTITVQAPGLRGEILIGALIPLSGELSSYGSQVKVADEMAINDLNSYVKILGLPITFKLLIEDTATDPQTALAKLQALYARGVRAVVGPDTSAELRNLKSYAEGNKIVICSPYSIASDLAIPDYIFRLTPTDRDEGKAIARLVYDYGIKYLYILYRNDAWGLSLSGMASTRFKELGGMVLGSIGYDPKKSDFSAELSAMIATVRESINKYGASKVGVLLLSFEEGGTIVAQASAYPELMSITWFGSDGTALNSKVIEVAGPYLVKIKFFSTIFAPAESPKFTDFVNRFKAKTGETPVADAVNAYDCVWLLGLAIIQAGKYDGEAIRNTLPAVAKTYFGASGWTLLDENGDRASGNYDVWAVVIKDGKPIWERVALVDTGTDSVKWFRRI